MRLGAIEIGIIIVIAIIIFGVVRMRQIGQSPAKENKTSARVTKRKNEKVSKRARHPRLQILGFILILVGILTLLTNINLAKWVAWAPIWALVIAAIGLVTIFIARRR